MRHLLGERSGLTGSPDPRHRPKLIPHRPLHLGLTRKRVLYGSPQSFDDFDPVNEGAVMRRIVRVVLVGLFAIFPSAGLVSPASADVSIRNGKVADLYVRSAQPSVAQMERQYAAFWNPNLPINPVRGQPQRQQPHRAENLRQVMSMSRSYDFFSIQGRVLGKPVVNGNRMSLRGRGVMAGFPASRSPTTTSVRAGCGSSIEGQPPASGCNGVKNWGY